jgi:hypothetical protein
MAAVEHSSFYLGMAGSRRVSGTRAEREGSSQAHLHEREKKPPPWQHQKAIGLSETAAAESRASFTLWRAFHSGRVQKRRAARSREV